MQPFVFVAPAGLAGLLLLLFGLPQRLLAASGEQVDEALAPRRFRLGALQAIGLVGVVVGIWLLITGMGEEVWRTTVATSSSAGIAGAAIACAWLLAVILDPRREGWRTAALVGVASTGLALAATNQWLVPALLFWVCSSLALGVLARDSVAPVVVWAAILLSDAALAAGLMGEGLGNGTWALAQPIDGWPAWFLGLAGIIRAGVVPAAGVWDLIGTRAAPALPLLVAGAFTLASGRMTGEAAWLAVALLLLVMLATARKLRDEPPNLGLICAWPPALALAITFVAPAATASAGVAAVLAVSALALFPSAPGRHAERGLLVAFVPVTAGFAPMVAAGGAAFERVSSSQSLADALPWALLTALLPVALLGGVVLGAQLGRRGDPRVFQPVPDVALWSLLAAGAVVAVAAPAGLGRSLSAPGNRVVSLYLAAALFGTAVAVAWGPLTTALRARMGGTSSVVSTTRPIGEGGQARPFIPGGELEVRVWTPSESAQNALARVDLVLVSLVAVAIVFFTVQGLRQGFL